MNELIREYPILNNDKIILRKMTEADAKRLSEITSQKGEDIEEEGCLSVGNFRGRVKRPYKITVSAFDRFGYPFTLTGEKWLARCICHEVDHLDGVLFVDKCLDKDKYLKQGGKL